jgi:hypothetical protein
MQFPFNLMSNYTRLLIKTVFSCWLVLSISSCHISYTLSGASIPLDAKTFSVQYITLSDQGTLAGPTYSQTLTDALRNYIASNCKLALVSHGDLDFQGSVTGYSIAPIAAQASTPNASSLTRLTVTIDITYTDKHDAKKGYNATFSRYADFPSSSPLSSVQNDLLTQIDKQLVQDVFDKAFNNW